MEVIDRVIKQNPWWENNKVDTVNGLKKRNLFETILPYIKTKQIISIVGLRRVGKTILLHQFIETLLKDANAKRILYFSFDELLGKDPEIIEHVLNAYEEEILKEKIGNVYVFFDEINHVHDWQVILKRYYDLGGIKFFISGSSSVFLKKAKESLAGRIYEFELAPLRFTEYLSLKNIKIQNIVIDKLKIKQELNTYLLNGGFPEIIEEKNFEKIQMYIRSIIEKIIFYDIPKVFDIENPLILKEIFESIAKNPGCFIEYKNLASTFHISYQTASKYISYLEKAFLIRLLYNFRGSPIAQARKSKKAYLSTVNLSVPYTTEKEFYSLIPKLAENLAVNHLHARFFWKKYYEIDILYEKIPIEVKYREEPKIKNVLRIAKELKFREFIVITKDFESKRKFDLVNVTFIPLWKWLLLTKEKAL